MGAGQKWEAWQKITCNTSHAATFSLIFVSVLPFLVGVFHIFLFFFQFCMFFSIYLQFLPIGRTVWQSSFEQKLGRTELENLAPPAMKKIWQERIEFWQDRMAEN